MVLIQSIVDFRDWSGIDNANTEFFQSLGNIFFNAYSIYNSAMSTCTHIIWVSHTIFGALQQQCLNCYMIIALYIMIIILSKIFFFNYVNGEK